MENTVFVKSASKIIGPRLRSCFAFTQSPLVKNNLRDMLEGSFLNINNETIIGVKLALESIESGEIKNLGERYHSDSVAFSSLATKLGLSNNQGVDKLHPFFFTTTKFDRMIDHGIELDGITRKSLNDIGIRYPNKELKNTIDVVALLMRNYISSVPIETISHEYMHKAGFHTKKAGEHYSNETPIIAQIRFMTAMSEGKRNKFYENMYSFMKDYGDKID